MTSQLLLPSFSTMMRIWTPSHSKWYQSNQSYIIIHVYSYHHFEFCCMYTPSHSKWYQSNQSYILNVFSYHHFELCMYTPSRSKYQANQSYYYMSTPTIIFVIWLGFQHLPSQCPVNQVVCSLKKKKANNKKKILSDSVSPSSHWKLQLHCSQWDEQYLVLENN